MKKGTNTLTIAIVVIFGILVIGLIAFMMMRDNTDTTVTNTNTNTVVNTNKNSNKNANKNTNSVTNANKNTNITVNANANTNTTNTNTVVNANTNTSTNANTNTAATNTNTSVNANTNSSTVSSDDKNTNEVVEDADGNRTRIVDLYFIDLDDNGKTGDAVGCGDSVVSVEKTANVTGFSTDGSIYAALSFLFVYKNQTVGGYYNALYQSDLAVDDVSLVGGIATVHLSGTTALGGTCDTPRFEAQINKTITQFPGVDSAVVYINDTKMEDALSVK